MVWIESLPSDDNVIDKLKKKYEELKDEVKNKTKDKYNEVKDKAKDKYNEVKDKAKDKYNEVVLDKEKWISKSPYLENWAAIFDYKDDSWEWEIVVRNNGNNYNVRVKKKVNGEWRTQRNGDNQKFYFKASNKQSFNLELWTVLNKTIGENRYKIPETSWKVYDLLNKDKKSENKNNSKDNKESKKDNSNEHSRKLDKKYEKKYWVELIRDWKLSFYVVKKWEWLKVIREKLSKISEFSYLKSEVYNIPEKNDGRNIRWFNTPNSSLIPGFYLPIPLKESDRTITVSDFKKKAENSLGEMENNKFYWEKMKKLLKKIEKKDVISIIAAYARSETAGKNLPIWYYELHRREPNWSAYSFSYFHILMWKWPWMNARIKLWLSEWDCYEPVNACKLFLWYCFEKAISPTYFFNINNSTDAWRVWVSYNWSWNYWNKLWENIKYCKTVK